VHSFLNGFGRVSGQKSPWDEKTLIREESFSAERLERLAASLAESQASEPPVVLGFSLQRRIRENAAALRKNYRESAQMVRNGELIEPATVRLLDNYHVIEEQIRAVQDELTPGLYRRMPIATAGPLSGHPRILALMWSFVAHTDSHIDTNMLQLFCFAFQRALPLEIAELRALPLTLRIVLVENARRLTDAIIEDRAWRARADALADDLLGVSAYKPASPDLIDELGPAPLPDGFVAQLDKRLRDQDPQTAAAQILEDKLSARNIVMDEVIHRAHQSYGASNVTLRNILASMRAIADEDWAEFIGAVSLVDQRLRQVSAFGQMESATRELYRDAVQRLARGSRLSELMVAEKLCQNIVEVASETQNADDKEERLDPGFHLIGSGLDAFEKQIEFRPSLLQSLGALLLAWRGPLYIGALLAVAGLILAAMVDASHLAGNSGWVFLAMFCGLFAALEAAFAVVNRAVAAIVRPRPLPGLELADAVPTSLRTIVVIPALMTSAEELRELAARLEVHYLASRGGDLTFALLLDGVDAQSEMRDGDGPLLAEAQGAIAELNEKYGRGPAGDRFLVLHRRRVFNETQRCWMGWERKRGKLHELNRLLRGATDTTFNARDAPPPVAPPDVRYVVTLDADTRLPRDSVRRLIGKMAHPLNKPRFEASGDRVVEGYAILQPRITPSMSVDEEASFYGRAFSNAAGIDPYAGAASDVYQDLFGEGIYTGKGIYDVDAFEMALAERIPENSLLSHDLFEGSFARAGLASDVEFVEDFPSRYDVAVRRQHRWARGDWQLLPWIARVRIAGAGGLNALSLAKMVDNLRRTLTAPMTFAALAVGWLGPAPTAFAWSIAVCAAVALPSFMPVAISLVPRRLTSAKRRGWRILAADARQAANHAALRLVFLADQAFVMADAIVRTLFRLYVSRRNLLEWVTAAQDGATPTPGLFGLARPMAGGVCLASLAGSLTLIAAPRSWPVVAPFMILWWAAPLIAVVGSRNRQLTPQPSNDQARSLRLIARRTWRYFEMFVTPASGMLPPDNYQESPKPVVAHRTSPTNLGLHLLAAVVARDFGWAGLVQTVERLELSFAAMARLKRFRGHFYNWYDTTTLQVLDPAYVSSVDSGNLAGNLIALANACREALAGPVSKDQIVAGLGDNLALAREALASLPHSRDGSAADLGKQFDIIESQMNESLDTALMLCALQPLAARADAIARGLSAAAGEEFAADLIFWTGAVSAAIEAHAQDARTSSEDLAPRLQALEKTAREMALGMQFDFLVDPERKLLSIGYSVSDSRRDSGCYDLLASEARLTSLFAIAKGDAPTRLWFRLGRRTVTLREGFALLSWSGSMFEYLMCSLLMRTPIGSLSQASDLAIVKRQQSYARALGLPWGISESGYNARDLAQNFQYLAFGVPDLALKRGMAVNAVIAPYATGLAAMVDPAAALANYAALEKVGALGRYGFYEAIDYTRARLPEGKTLAVIDSYMAHHQGMTIVAIANTLQRGRMRDRFHAEPMIQACELLLHEPAPREFVPAFPVEEIKVAPTQIDAKAVTERRLGPPSELSPQTHLLSNGDYSVMLTSGGSGFSQWRGVAVTRWREDSPQDDSGAYVFIRDVRRGSGWSATYQPGGASPDSYQATFSEDRAEFVRRDGSMTTTLEIVVATEANAEVRRLSLANSGPVMREFELTSFAEIALAPAAADGAHPAFSKMFVETEYSQDLAAIIATRRKRSPDEPELWAAHFAVVEGRVAAKPSFETDRAGFIGRGRGIGDALANEKPGALSGAVGAVLDPIFALRQRLLAPPGQTVRVAYWTIVASTREELVSLIDARRDADAYHRARIMAWTQAQVELHHLDLSPAMAVSFQSLAGFVLFADPRLRPSSETITRGAGAQAGLWRHGISGDLPIVVARIDDIEDFEIVGQLIRAHEYWRSKQLRVDLVVLNERTASYVQDLQTTIETAIRTRRLGPRQGDASGAGGVHVLRADLIDPAARALLLSAARVVLVARRGDLAQQLSRMPLAIVALGSRAAPKNPLSPIPAASRPAAPRDLEYFNGIGGFDKAGREYVVHISRGRTPPAPWINVVANASFGFQVAAEGSGYTWSLNSRENQLTAWSNDPVTDAAGEAFYLRDDISGALWSPTVWPIRDDGDYVARHGFGYSRFEHRAYDIETELLQFVPLSDPVKIQRLTIRNRSTRARRLTVTLYVEWVLGTARAASAPFVVTGLDAETRALTAQNPWSTTFGSRIAFADLAGAQMSWTADRRQFIGRNGSLRNPAGTGRGAFLSGRCGGGLDPCAALQCSIELAPGETMEIVSFIGQAATIEEARELIVRMRATGVDASLAAVERYWRDIFDSTQVTTPNRAMDIMLNGWLPYQTLACRITARSAFYQASGAYGFRDQLQDNMALTGVRPAATREHLLRAASRQFLEGDVQHWWLPFTGQGVRTKISDDRVWLAYCVADYIGVTGDSAILDEPVAFLEGRAVGEHEHDAFYVPEIAEEKASLFEHCARALDQSMALTGPHGLPLMGTGDWNDGMNRVGELGRGESVWLAWFLIRAIDRFAPLAKAKSTTRVKRWRAHAVKLKAAIEHNCWDGAWYRRAIFDDGTPLGSASDDECRIDSIAQSWAVLSGAADPERSAQAMASLDQYLVRPDDRLVLLFTPPFDKTRLDPGYIKGYPPGMRENGGQYTHAATWAAMAHAKLGQGDIAGQLFDRLNPINHALSASDVERYKVEPYVVVADIYSVAPHVGRGGWTWYTGSAGWLYRVGVESILGLEQRGAQLVLNPCIPSAWPGFTAIIRRSGGNIDIAVENPRGVQSGVSEAWLDGAALKPGGPVCAPLDGKNHALRLVLG